MIKVVQVNYSREATGSAAWRLHNAFNEDGIDSTLLLHKPSEIIDSKVKHLGLKSKIIAKIDNRLQAYLSRNNIKQYGLFSFPILGVNISKLEVIKNADIIYLHWTLMGFLNLSNIEQLLKLNKPVVITMHDMWHITGGCHYSFDCEKYKSECYNCQIFDSNKKKDLSTTGFYRKLKLYSKYNNLYFISPSKWLLDCAEQSYLTKGKPLFHIPNVLDKQIFKPFNKLVARQILNLPETGIIIAFGAVHIDSPYKGWPYLRDALNILYKEGLTNVTILIFGSGKNKIIEDAIPFTTKFTGHLKDEYSLALVYNAANVFIAPSLAETLGYVIMESLSCGTPVVGFDIGGIPDLIQHKINGYLAKYKSSGDLAEGIKYCIEEKLTGELPEQFDTDKVISLHHQLIDSIKNKQPDDEINT